MMLKFLASLSYDLLVDFPLKILGLFHIHDLLDKIKLLQVKEVLTPLLMNQVLTINDNLSLMDAIKYRQVLGPYNIIFSLAQILPLSLTCSHSLS